MVSLTEINQMPNEALTANFYYEFELLTMAPERIKKITENLISKIELQDKLTIEFPILYSNEEPEIVAEVLRLLLQTSNKFKVTCLSSKQERLFSLLLSVESPKVFYTFDSESTNNTDIQKMQIQYSITSTQAV